MEHCRDAGLSRKFSHLHGGTLELCQSDQGPSPPIAQFGQAASSRKSLGVSKLFQFKNDGGLCVHGGLQCYRNVFVPFPKSVPRHNAVSALCGQFLRPHGLDSALTCTVNCGTLYGQVCAFPKHVQSIEHQSRCRIF